MTARGSNSVVLQPIRGGRLVAFHRADDRLVGYGGDHGTFELGGKRDQQDRYECDN